MVVFGPWATTKPEYELWEMQDELLTRMLYVILSPPRLGSDTKWELKHREGGLYFDSLQELLNYVEADFLLNS
jgi:hypothetical protein